MKIGEHIVREFEKIVKRVLQEAEESGFAAPTEEVLKLLFIEYIEQAIKRVYVRRP